MNKRKTICINGINVCFDFCKGHDWYLRYRWLIAEKEFIEDKSLILNLLKKIISKISAYLKSKPKVKMYMELGTVNLETDIPGKKGVLK